MVGVQSFLWLGIVSYHHYLRLKAVEVIRVSFFVYILLLFCFFIVGREYVWGFLMVSGFGILICKTGGKEWAYGKSFMIEIDAAFILHFIRTPIFSWTPCVTTSCLLPVPVFVLDVLKLCILGFLFPTWWQLADFLAALYPLEIFFPKIQTFTRQRMDWPVERIACCLLDGGGKAGAWWW